MFSYLLLFGLLVICVLIAIVMYKIDMDEISVIFITFSVLLGISFVICVFIGIGNTISEKNDLKIRREAIVNDISIVKSFSSKYVDTKKKIDMANNNFYQTLLEMYKESKNNIISFNKDLQTKKFWRKSNWGLSFANYDGIEEIDIKILE